MARVFDGISSLTIGEGLELLKEFHKPSFSTLPTLNLLTYFYIKCLVDNRSLLIELWFRYYASTVVPKPRFQSNNTNISRWS